MLLVPNQRWKHGDMDVPAFPGAGMSTSPSHRGGSWRLHTGYQGQGWAPSDFLAMTVGIFPDLIFSIPDHREAHVCLRGWLQLAGTAQPAAKRPL